MHSAVIVLADIGGYTRFMKKQETSLVHAEGRDHGSHRFGDRAMLFLIRRKLGLVPRRRFHHLPGLLPEKN
jgi:hypothetical protein